MMFRKVKFIVIAAFIALGLSACSSDDGNPVLKLDKNVYNVLIEITEDVDMDEIVSFYYDGVHVQEEKIYEKPIPVVIDEDEEGEQEEEEEDKITEWTRSYTLTAVEHVSIEAFGKSTSSGAKLSIVVTDKNDFVVQEKKVEGKDLYVAVKF
ncbi:hypothetical protein [Myroides sp. DW712]|uniref:hypothetical protein n=1 Tax=Myroides sp. DW712 TaxID=3389800 RepID=UPI00397E0554